MLTTGEFEQPMSLAPSPSVLGYEQALSAGGFSTYYYLFMEITEESVPNPQDIVVTAGYNPAYFFQTNSDLFTNLFESGFEIVGLYASNPAETIVVTAPARNPCLGAAANAIATTIAGIDDVYGPTIGPSWRGAEYIAMITRDADGNFGAGGGTISTDGLLRGANLTNPTLEAGEVAIGIIHNHPDLLGPAEDDAEGRYPSSMTDGPDDWDALARFAQAYGVANPSLFIIDNVGVTREYRLSDRAFFESMTAQQRIDGVGLPAPVSCSNNSQSGGGANGGGGGTGGGGGRDRWDLR